MKPTYGVVGLLVVLGVGRAIAQPMPDDRERAAELNRQAEIAYEHGEFREAAQLLEFAYKAHPEPRVLYNLGQARERLGELDAAIEAYRRYLEAAPTAADHDQVVALITELEARPRPPPEVVPPIDPPTQPPLTRPDPAIGITRDVPPARRASKLPWLVIGSGAAIVGAGVAFGVMVGRENDRAEAATSQAAVARHLDRAERNEKLQLAGLIGGGAIIVGGVVWAVLDRRSVRRETARVRVEVGPGSVVAAFAF